MNTNLTPYLWEAPLKPYHLKPVNAECIIGNKMYKSHIYVCHGCGKLVAYAYRNGERYLCDVTTSSRRSSRRGRSTSFEFQPSDHHSQTCNPDAANAIHPKALDYIYRQQQLFERADSSPFFSAQMALEDALEQEIDAAIGRALDDARGI
jgi:hypothetical protein